MILKINKDTKQLVSWMDELPKKASIVSEGKTIRTHDIRRNINGEYNTAGGFIWKEVIL